MSSGREGGLARSSLGRVLDDLGITLLEVAHGRIDPDRDVGGVVIHDPADEPVYPSGAIVLGVGTRGAAALAALLDDLGGHDVTALVVRSPVEVTDAVRAAADAQGIPVLGLARGATWTQLAALLRSLLAEDDIGETQVESLGGLPSGDLFAVANAIASLIDAPITIEDRSSRVLAFSGRQEEADASRAETIIGRQVPARYARALTEMGVFRDLYRDDRPVVVDPIRLGEGVSTQRIAIAVRAGDEVLGSIWAAMDGPLTPERTATLRDAAKLVALHLLRVRAGADVQRRLRAELVGTALEGGAGAGDALGRLSLAGQRVCVIAAALVSESRAGSPHPNEFTIAERERFTDALAVHLSAVQHGSATALVGDTAYGLLPAAGEAAEERSVRVVEDFLERVGSRMPAVVAVGPPADDITGIARSRAAALRVLRVLREPAPTAGRRRVARAADVQTESLLLELRDLIAARGDELSGPVGRLVEHDRRGDGRLVDTLQAWLDNFGDIGAAAAASFVHPNTFRYRLRRAAEVSGIDLADADARFSAMLHLRMLGRLPPPRAKAAR
ncbi:PucR family transcriptional regulator [Microbacterium sp. CFBP9034]|uniref:PucR family transcriptional regulator n=1 Tax=Microbacterium sp. CFBP9034 TaxID=3096540 RepID=UPI002A6A6117|nr:helix-turn-helix domain-containing protein [Microbacterium sp. CFBP9034]MDY0909704.1 helix-turn-helix domain-containing protein [Microbacterium sp. CFBP9034]